MLKLYLNLPRPSIRLVSLSLMVLGTLGSAGCDRLRQASQPEQPAQAEDFVAVDAVTVQPGSLTEPLSYTGTTQPKQQVVLRARVAGEVLFMGVDVGDRVSAGDTLVELDVDLLAVAVDQATAELQARQAEVAQAAAAVSDAQTALESARVELEQGQTEADRLARLAAEGAVSTQEAERAQVTVETALQVLASATEQVRTRREAVRAAEGRVSAQQSIIDQATERLSFATVLSPIAGVVLSRAVETGDYVESGDEVLQVGDLSEIKVRIQVSDRDLGKISVGQPVKVTLDAFPDQSLSGRVTRIAPTADPTSRLLPVEVTIPNPTGRIGSGFLARVSVQPEGSDRALAIPPAALEIAEDATTPTVFVVNIRDGQEGTVMARSVTLGREAQGRVEITAGLQPGETIVVRSGRPLADSQPVRLSILSEVKSKEESRSQ